MLTLIAALLLGAPPTARGAAPTPSWGELRAAILRCPQVKHIAWIESRCRAVHSLNTALATASRADVERALSKQSPLPWRFAVAMILARNYLVKGRQGFGGTLRLSFLLARIHKERNAELRRQLATLISRIPLTSAEHRKAALALLRPPTPVEVRAIVAERLLKNQPEALASEMLAAILSTARGDPNLEVRRRALMGMRHAPKRTTKAVCPIAAKAARGDNVFESSNGAHVLASATGKGSDLLCAPELQKLLSWVHRRAKRRPAKRYLGGQVMGFYELCSGKRGSRWQPPCLALMRTLLANRRRYDWTRGEAARHLAGFAKRPKRELRRYLDDSVKTVSLAAAALFDPPLVTARRFAWAILEGKKNRARYLLADERRRDLERKLQRLRGTVPYQVLRAPWTKLVGKRTSAEKICRPTCPGRRRCGRRCRQAPTIEMTLQVRRRANALPFLVVTLTDQMRRFPHLYRPRPGQAKAPAPRKDFKVVGWRWKRTK